MFNYIVRRIALGLLTLILISFLVYALIRHIPGTPLTVDPAMMRPGKMPSQVDIARWEKLYGLDKPWYEAYFVWLGNVVRLDLGRSIPQNNAPVLDLIVSRAPATLLLSVTSLVLSYLLSIPIGLWATVRNGTIRERAVSTLLYMLYSLPSFVAALYLQLLFYSKLGWLPLFGMQSDDYATLSAAGKSWDLLKHAILPITCFTYGSLAYYSRFVQANMEEVIRQDYIRTARAKGVSPIQVIWKHAFRNTLIPFVTLLGLTLPSLLGGAVILEQIFVWPGMGRLFFEAIGQRDYDTIMGLTLMFSILTLIGQLLADILYAVVDPRHPPIMSTVPQLEPPPSPPPSPAEQAEASASSAGYWRETWRHYRRRKLAVMALAFVGFLCVVALFAPIIVGTKPIVCRYKDHIYFPFLGYYARTLENPIFVNDRFRDLYTTNLPKKDPNSWAIWPLVYQDPYRRVRDGEWHDQPGNPVGTEGEPNHVNWLGTNQQGFDVFAQMVHGTQIALSVGFVSMSIAAAIGITLGALAGYLGGWVDMLVSRFIEVVMCIPALVLILALVAMLPSVSNYHLMAIVGITGWTGIARLARAEFMKLKELEFVSAARAMGAGRMRIMFRHLLRNALAPVLVPITFGIADAILIESGLSYLGFGASPPNPSWGTLLHSGRIEIQQMWWLILFPGLAIFITVLAYNLIGEGLQEATDPRLRQPGT